ncbi:hypothetical protein Btru_072026 [Bulinus truncatus]|nr:hypothetical protein Btru_072026 [Bulinus truncatus]
MHSERALGMFDANCARAKNATAGFVDGKVKFKINKTMQRLTSKDLTEQECIISFSICHAAKKRKSLCLREVEIQQASSLIQKKGAEHFLGRTLYHTWETEESDEVFTGTVINVQDHVLTLKYYGEKKTTKLSLYAIIVDVMLCDIIFTQATNSKSLFHMISGNTFAVVLQLTCCLPSLCISLVCQQHISRKRNQKKSQLIKSHLNLVTLLASL